MALLDTDYRTLESEYESLLPPTQARPKAVLFGDSMSEYVGYNTDGTPNTKYGNSIADVIGNNLGIGVENLATGGETSNEALAGGSKFGAFADYIAQNRPEYAIIRYGAADAIKNKDPNVTLQSVQQMVDIARANGVTPIIVGVSELYGAQNSKTGNIAGYIDPGAEQRANAINAGLAQLAANNGLAFTDVRSAVSAGKGDLLDGVHTNADFGKKMADAISESIVEQGAIQGANVPQLPPNVDSLSNEEKGRLYNQLIDQGYTDAQIRTAAKAESEQDWNALKQIAANVKNVTPETIERRVALEAAPVTETAPAGQASIANYIQQAADFLNSPENLRMAEGAAQMQQVTLPDGRSINVYPDGTAQEFTDGRVKVYNSSGETILNQTQQEYAQRGYLTPIVNALMAAAGGAVLGPAGAGLLSAPAAAATAAGGTSLLRGGSVEDALKAAALAGAAGFGMEQVTGLLNNAAYDLSFAAADAAQLANQGLSASAIAQNLATYVDPATAISLANNAATQAFALADATQLTQQGLSQNQVAQVLQSSGINANTAANIAQAAADGVTTLTASDIIPEVKFQRQTNLNQGLLSPADAERVMVTGQAFDIPGIQQLAQGVGAGISAATVPTAPQVVTQPQGGQQVQQAQIEAPRIDPDAASSILSSVLGQPIYVAGSTQQVQVTGETPRQISQNEAAAALSSLTGQQVQVTGQTVTNQQLAETLPAGAAALLQSVPVTGQTMPGGTAQSAAPAALGGLLQTVPVTGQTMPGGTAQAALPASTVGLLTQTVPITGQNVPTTQLQTTIPAAAAALLQTVPVTGQNLPAGQQVAGPAGAMLGTAIAPTQTVPVEDRTIKRETTAPVLTTTPGQAVTVEGRTIPTANVVVPTGAAGAALGVSAPAQPTTITARDAALASLLLAGAGSLGGGGQPGGAVSGPISGVIPTYPGRGVYPTPGLGGYQTPGMFQIAPTNVYNPFATVAPFGAGRFGAINQPFTLPRGLI